MSDLRSKVIRLAHQKPELRAALLPLLKEADGQVAVPSKVKTDAALKLQSIVKRYKKYERNDPELPPKSFHGYWAFRDGQVSEFTDEYLSQRTVLVGVKIGSRFAEPTDYVYPSDEGRPEARAKQRKVVDKLKSDTKKVLQTLVDTYGGYIMDSYGSSYSVLGWSRPVG
jgi:hypothetical protein